MSAKEDSKSSSGATWAEVGVRLCAEGHADDSPVDISALVLTGAWKRVPSNPASKSSDTWKEVDSGCSEELGRVEGSEETPAAADRVGGGGAARR